MCEKCRIEVTESSPIIGVEKVILEPKTYEKSFAAEASSPNPLVG